MLQDTKWLLVLEVLYGAIGIVAVVRIIYDTRSVSKTLAYLLLVVFVPILGAIFYFSFGVNYRKRKMYTKKLKMDDATKAQLQREFAGYGEQVWEKKYPVLKRHGGLVRLLSSDRVGRSLLSENQEVKVLQNGEELFPRLIEEMKKAQHHIHIEFYIFENDEIGRTIRDVMIAKAKEGVEVRFIYDDFGSLSIRRSFVRELRENGVEAYPFNRIRIIGLANRLNYRNHRKIVVIDGVTSFVGGINVSDKYINTGKGGLYWRDTHMMIRGLSTFTLQQIFLTDWNFCSKNNIRVEQKYFPLEKHSDSGGNLVQIVASGPDSELPGILFSIMQAVNQAEKEIFIVTPYYIPDASLQEALVIAALRGVEVKLLVPEKGDSFTVSIASHSYFDELLSAGVRIYLYQKGFIHAKTFVIDRVVASVGTANMDTRSFDLNFEVTAIVYDEKVAEEMARQFFEDLGNSRELHKRSWGKRPWWKIFAERLVRLVSPML